MIMGHFINVYKLKKEGEKGTSRRKEAIVRRDEGRMEVGDEVELMAEVPVPRASREARAGFPQSLE